MAFCLQCGQQLKDDVKFCLSCGMKLSAVEDSEIKDKVYHAQMVLTTYKKESMFKSIPCYMIFYDDQIVFAFLSKDRQKEEHKKLVKQLKEEGNGLLKSSFAIMKYWNNYGNKYLEMTSDQAILEYSMNYRIYHNEVEKLILKISYNNQMNYEGYQQTSNGQIIIHANGIKHKFIHNHGKDANTEDILRRIYGIKLKTK